MKLRLAIRELHRAEQDLADHLTRLADRHRADHEIWHVARDLAGWSRDHLAELARAGRGYGLRLAGASRHRFGWLAAIRSQASDLVGRRPEPDVVMLADLRALHRKAAGVSLDWELLGQAARVSRDMELLELTHRCHPETLRQMRWANAMLKTLSPRVVASH